MISTVDRETKQDEGAAPRPIRAESSADDRADRDPLYEVLLRSRSVLQRTVGRYDVIDKIGEGGMGVVLEAFDPMLDRRVAIKVLHRDLSERHTQRLVREAQAMACLRHPHVVQVYEVSEADGQAFIVMELVRGKPLGDWQRAEPRPSWRALVRAYCQAGRGLAAAHAQGLVHRDFKPGNAVMDEQGRVQVLDFGLARRAEERSSADDVLTSQELSLSLTIEEPLTRTGTVLGTPGYMSPEQIKGEAVDGRSDQFSLCVALYEALYGQRPFAGRSMAVLHVAIKSGRLEPVPRGHRIPTRVRKALLRGLEADPQQRWPSMGELVDELERLSEPPRRRGWAVGLVAGVAMAGIGVSQAARVTLGCEGAAAHRAQVWGVERRQQVEASIARTGLSHAPQTWSRVAPALDAYAEQWARRRGAVCEAPAKTEARDSVDDRVECLERGRRAFEQVVDVLADANPHRVRNAVALVSGLPPLSRCDEVGASPSEPATESLAVQQRVRELRAQLERARALRRAGEHEGSLEIVEQVLVGVDAMPARAPSLRSEALFERGRSRADRGQSEQAEGDLERAYLTALEHHHEEVMLRASIGLLDVSIDQQQVQSARHWGKSALALARRRVDEPMTEAQVWAALARLSSLEGRPAEALAHRRRALEITVAARGRKSQAAGVAMRSLATLLQAQGRARAALPLLREGFEIYERALGTDHPEIVGVLEQLASVLVALEQHDEALAVFRKSLEVCERAYGLVHPKCARVLEKTGSVWRQRGALEVSEAHHRRAAAILEHALGPSHPELGRSEQNIGHALHEQGRLEDGLHHLQRALSIAERAQGPMHSGLVPILGAISEIQADLGRTEPALAHARWSLTLKEHTLEAGDPELAVSFHEVVDLLCRLGRVDEALVAAERGRSLMEDALGTDDPSLVSMLTDIGRLLRERGQKEDAREVLVRALVLADSGGDPQNPALAEPLLELSRLALAEGDAPRAATHAERALWVRRSASVSAEQIAAAQVQLAYALVDEPSLRGWALRLAHRARATLLVAGPGGLAELRALDEWLAEREAVGLLRAR